MPDDRQAYNRNKFLVTVVLQQTVEAHNYDEAIKIMERQGADKIGNLECLEWIGAQDFDQKGRIILPTKYKG